MDTARKYQLDIASASNINSPQNLMATHQKTQSPDPAAPADNLSNNRFDNAMFDNYTVKKMYSETMAFAT